MSTFSRVGSQNFKESEIKIKTPDENEIKSTIIQLERELEVLHSMSHYFTKKKNEIRCINGVCGIFPKSRERHLNNISTINRTINKIYDKYLKIKNQ